MMFELLREQAAPELETDISDGNPMDIHYFIGVFKEVVENKVTDSRWWLTYLIKFMKAEAKEIANNSIQLPEELGFKTVKQLLTKRHGYLHIIAASYCKEVKQWSGSKSRLEMLMLTEDFRISWLSVKMLTICRVGVCWIHQTLSVCCYLSCLTV